MAELLPKFSKETEKRFIVTSLILVIYFVLFCLGFIYQSIFNSSNTIATILPLIPLSGDSSIFFVQGLLTYCSILFGFYSIVLIQAIPRLSIFFKNHIPRLTPEYRLHIFLAGCLVLLFFVPFFYLFDSIPNSLIAIGGYGYIQNFTSAHSTSNSINISISMNENSVNSSLIKIDKNVINDVFSATWVVLIDIITYVLIELGILDALINHKDKFFEIFKLQRNT